MIPTSRRSLVIFLGLLATALIALPCGLAPPPYERMQLAGVLTVAVEFAAFFIAILLTGAEISAPASFMLAVLAVLARCILSALGGGVLALLSGQPGPDAFINAWIGNPIGVFLQIVLLMLVLPHALSAAAPGLVSHEMERAMEGGAGKKESGEAMERVAGQGANGAGAFSIQPTGGAIQVFGFDELQSIFRKSTGMEGFILYTSEGLVLWKDMPIRMNVELLVARLQSQCDGLTGTVEDFGLTRARKVIVDSREHFLLNTRLNNNFSLIMLFSNQVDIAAAWNRLAIMAKTSREFLQWRYPALPSLKELPTIVVGR